MCGLCGVIDADRHWSGGGANTDPTAHERRLARARLAGLATAMLRPYHIVVEDFGGVAFIVRGATGASELAPGLPQVWRAAERIAGRPPDPLAPPLPCAPARDGA